MPLEIARHRRWLLAAYAAALFALTLAPLPGVITPPTLSDKVAHFLLFAGLAAVMYWNLERPRGPLAIGAALLLTVLVAGLIELLQGLLPYRSNDPWDLAAGAVGATLGAGAAWALLSEGRERAPG